jgi:putative ABC transport system substrate-binding protein
MNRRGLMLLTAGAFMAGRRLSAQQNAMPVIGYLGNTSPGETATPLAGIHQGLREAGWVDGQNVTIEYRWAGGRFDRLPALAADLVGRRVDVIIASGPGIPVAKEATSTIPIIFFGGYDLVAAGLIKSLAGRAATSRASA